jgi:hypothetical protein
VYSNKREDAFPYRWRADINHNIKALTPQLREKEYVYRRVLAGGKYGKPTRSNPPVDDDLIDWPIGSKQAKKVAKEKIKKAKATHSTKQDAMWKRGQFARERKGNSGDFIRDEVGVNPSVPSWYWGKDGYKWEHWPEALSYIRNRLDMDNRHFKQDSEEAKELRSKMASTEEGQRAIAAAEASLSAAEASLSAAEAAAQVDYKARYETHLAALRKEATAKADEMIESKREQP